MSRKDLAFALVLLAWGCSSGAKEGTGTISSLPPDSGKVSTRLEARGEDKAAAVVAEDTLTDVYALKDFSKYSLADPIIMDLNGDQVNDTATFETRNHKAGVVIADGRTSLQTLIGCGHAFEEMGDDFSWVDAWGVVRDSSTYEVVIEDGEITGGRPFVLDHPSIYVQKAEVGGGVITFKNGRFRWVHQAD